MKTALFSPLLRFFLCHRVRRREKLCMIEATRENAAVSAAENEVYQHEDHGHRLR